MSEASGKRSDQDSRLLRWTITSCPEPLWLAILELDQLCMGSAAWARSLWEAERRRARTEQEPQYILYALGAGGEDGAATPGDSERVPGAGSLAAFALASVLSVDRSLEILKIAVHPRFRRLGCGRSLLQAITREAGTLDCVRLMLDVASANAAALALYKHTGFREVGRRRNYYGQGLDAVLMDRTVPESRGAFAEKE